MGAQKSVLAQSSLEAEYLSGVRLPSEMLCVQELIHFMGFGISMQIEGDASSAIAIATRRVTDD